MHMVIVGEALVVLGALEIGKHSGSSSPRTLFPLPAVVVGSIAARKAGCRRAAADDFCWVLTQDATFMCFCEPSASPSCPPLVILAKASRHVESGFQSPPPASSKRPLPSVFRKSVGEYGTCGTRA